MTARQPVRRTATASSATPHARHPANSPSADTPTHTAPGNSTAYGAAWRAKDSSPIARAATMTAEAADAPTVRPLESGYVPAPADQEPARTLPPTVTVCHEPGGSRCWTRPLADDCAQDGGRVYRIVPGDASGRDAQAALVQCRAAATRTR